MIKYALLDISLAGGQQPSRELNELLAIKGEGAAIVSMAVYNDLTDPSGTAHALFTVAYLERDNAQA
jgi:hypothetical protein